MNWSLENKRWGPKVSKLFQIDLALLDVRLVYIDDSVNIFLVFLFLYKFFFVFVFNIVTGLNVSELN